jgi:SAM-dependent methyltransferase
MSPVRPGYGTPSRLLSVRPSGDGGTTVAGGTTAPPGIDTTVPSTARMYDFWLGGKDHFAVDRTAALEVSAAAPELKMTAVENRKFLRRAVRYLAAEAGIAQFLDIGTGLPTQGNVHQVAQQVNPDARVVYVDNDPMVLAHSRALKTSGNTAVIEADLRDPAAILNHPRTRALIDFSQPLAVLLVAVLHFIDGDDDPYAIVKSICDAMAPGSCLVVSHAAGGIVSGDSAGKVAEQYRKNVASGSTLRDRDEILRFFAGLELVEPGLVQVPYWRPDEPESLNAGRVWVLGAVGHKPGLDAAAELRL